MSRPSTQSIDKLFLELSQFTQATTAKEMRLQEALEELINACEASAWLPALRVRAAMDKGRALLQRPRED
jgi:hypothetical protein